MRLQQLLSKTIFQDCTFKDPFLYCQHLWLTNSYTNKSVRPCMKFEYLCNIKFIEYNNINENLFTLLWIYKHSFFLDKRVIENIYRPGIMRHKITTRINVELSINGSRHTGLKSLTAWPIKTLNKWMTKNATINDMKPWHVINTWFRLKRNWWRKTDRTGCMYRLSNCWHEPNMTKHHRQLKNFCD